MNNTLGFLRESLSNYVENHMECKDIYDKIEKNNYENEVHFVRDLDEREIEVLNTILENEIKYAQDEQDIVRTKELSEVYELLI